MKGSAKTICASLIDTDNTVVMAGVGGEGGARGRFAKGGNGNIYNSVNNKASKKRRKL